MESEHATSTMTKSDDNPYITPRSSFDPIEDRAAKTLRALRLCTGLQCTTIVLGVAAAFYDIESIVGTGPVLFFIGIPVAVLSRRLSLTMGLAFGVSGPAISLLCLMLINVLGWSPGDAQQPVSAIAAAYTTFALPLGLYVWTGTGSDSIHSETESGFDDALTADNVWHET